MMIGPEPIRRTFWRSRRLGKELLFDQSVHDRGFRRGLIAPVEDVVEAAGADPGHLAIAPELLAQHAHALLDALLDRVRLHARLALRGEYRPLRLLPGLFGLAIGDQIFRHRVGPPLS